MYIALEDFASACHVETAEVIREPVNLSWHTCRSRDLDDGPVTKSLTQHLFIEQKAADTWRGHKCELGEHSRLLPAGNFVDVILDVNRAEEESHHAA